KIEREAAAARWAQKLAELKNERDAAKAYPVKVESSGDEINAPVLETNGRMGVRRWAVVGEQCFPIVYKLDFDAYWLEESGIGISLEDLMSGWHVSRGYAFEKW